MNESPYRAPCPNCRDTQKAAEEKEKELTEQAARFLGDIGKLRDELAKLKAPKPISRRVSGTVLCLLLTISSSFLATYVYRAGFEFPSFVIGYIMMLVFIMAALGFALGLIK